MHLRGGGRGHAALGGRVGAAAQQVARARVRVAGRRSETGRGINVKEVLFTREPKITNIGYVSAVTLITPFAISKLAFYFSGFPLKSRIYNVQ